MMVNSHFNMPKDKLLHKLNTRNFAEYVTKIQSQRIKDAILYRCNCL